MSKRIWHNGPPPHVGWWNASVSQDIDLWRWWNGKTWSWGAWSSANNVKAGKIARCKSSHNESKHPIQWTHYYPENARVPRVKP